MDLYNADTIKSLLNKHGFRFSKSLGQNFLRARWVPEQIVERAPVDETSGIVEIGPGIGVLTQELAKTCGKVVGVELDRALLPLLQETLAAYDNVEIIHADALKMDYQALIVEKLAGLTPRVCANLPYNITAPLLGRLIDSGCFASITVMVQKEVAERMCAQPGSTGYGAFSVFIRYHTDPQILFDVPPDCFIPRPKVTSSVITLTRCEKPSALVDEALFFRVVRAAFSQRRKTLVNCLSSAFGQSLHKETLIELVAQCGLDIQTRGETLSIPDFISLTNAMYAAICSTR